MNIYRHRFNRFKRSFLDYRFAWRLVDEFYWVKNYGTRFYGIVGSGGTGKSTLAMNMFYFLDPTLDIARTNIYDADSFLAKLEEYPIGSMKSVYLDEPDDKSHTLSKEGKAVSEVAGKWRQHKLFLGILATNIKHIPLGLFDALHGIIYLPKWGTGVMFRDREGREEVVMAKIKKEYATKGYKVFHDMRKEYPHLVFNTYKDPIFTEEERKEYDKIKANDYFKSIRRARELIAKKNKHAKKTKHLDRILELRKKGKKYKEISDLIGLSKGRISQILKDAKV